MTLTTTVGSSTADSMGTLVEFQAYAAAFAFDLTGKTDPDQEVALRKGAAYLQRAYEGKWKGYRTNQGQAMPWPRRSYPENSTGNGTGFNGILDGDGFEVPTDEIPQKVKNAQFEAAFSSLGGTDLLPTLERGGAIQSESAGAGPAKASTTYAPGASPRDKITTIEGLVQHYVTGHPGGSISTGKVVRG